MFQISIIASDSAGAETAYQCLSRRGYGCVVVADDADILLRISEKPPDLIVMSSYPIARMAELAHDLKHSMHLPVVALFGKETLAKTDGPLEDVDDFVVIPFEPAELDLRVRRLLEQGAVSPAAEQVACGDLRIDLAKCEVSVSGRPVVLTFKEYELLKYLVANEGRVCTRENLLDKVWGYDYYGGDRTVDVHIRRLRSKLEDAGHTFVETIRNIGYRFRAEP